MALHWKLRVSITGPPEKLPEKLVIQLYFQLQFPEMPILQSELEPGILQVHQVPQVHSDEDFSFNFVLKFSSLRKVPRIVQ